MVEVAGGGPSLGAMEELLGDAHVERHGNYHLR